MGFWNFLPHITQYISVARCIGWLISVVQEVLTMSTLRNRSLTSQDGGASVIQTNLVLDAMCHRRDDTHMLLIPVQVRSAAPLGNQPPTMDLLVDVGLDNDL